MKRIKKLASLMLAVILVLAMGIQVMANEVPVTITLPEDALLDGHEFTAYQIFTGTQANVEDQLASVEWASEINAKDFLAELNGLEAFKDCTTARDVAEALATNTALAEQVAQIAYKHVQGAGRKLQAGANSMPAGYYLIVDTTENVGADGVYNAALLQATKNVEVQVKTDKPSLDKKITENGNPVDFNNGAIGQVVNYELTSKVPDMSHYVNYKYVVTDVMSKGLTLNKDSVKVTVGGVEALYTLNEINIPEDAGNEYAEGTAFKIVFTNFYETYKNSKGAEIKITYSATINENAVIGTVGNPNEASLKYSNNPNKVGEGDDFPENPDENDPSGKTPWDETRTFVTAIELFKTDENGNALPGAQFKITGTKLITTLVTGIEYVEKANGGYWQIQDDEGNISYTDVAPTTQGLSDAAKAKYVNPDVQYGKETANRKVTEAEAVNATAEVGVDGILRIEGLAAGDDYVITEIMAPNGYNLLANPIKLVINYADPAEGQTTCTWSGTYDLQDGNGAKELGFNGDIGALTFSVENKSGSLLPSTGGIGTTIFYVVGGVLVAGAGILLVTKKRMSAR